MKINHLRRHRRVLSDDADNAVVGIKRDGNAAARPESERWRFGEDEQDAAVPIESPAHMVSQTPSEARAGMPLADVSEARLRALTEHALEIITVQDAKGVFTYANEAVAR